MSLHNTGLIQRAKNGDSEAFGELIASHERLVYNIALRTVKNPEDARDISQEAFIKAYKNIKKFDEKSAFSTWIYKITVNTAIDEMRKRKGKETVSADLELDLGEGSVAMQLIDGDGTPEEEAMRQETRRDILSAINMLSEEHRRVVALRDLNGLSYSDIAEITDSTMGTVKSRLARARAQLRNILLEISEHYGKEGRQNM